MECPLCNRINKDMLDHLVTENCCRSDAKILVLLVVPHNICITNREHSCDASAMPLALRIYNMGLKRSNQVQFGLLSSNVSRTVCDNNRRNCRKTYLKKCFMAILDQCSKNNMKTIVLDIHSYSCDTQYKISKSIMCDQYVYQLSDRWPPADYVKQLSYVFTNYNIANKIIMGKNNDIIDLASEYPDVVTTLIEIREGFDEKIIANAVISWLASIVEDEKRSCNIF